jgi:hypothetical protein
MLEITETGEARIATLEFAEEVRKFIRAWRAAGKPEEEGQKMVVARIALALIERDGESGPAITQAEGREFEQFVDEHVPEIHAAVGKCLDTLICNDTNETQLH